MICRIRVFVPSLNKMGRVKSHPAISGIFFSLCNAYTRYPQTLTPNILPSRMTSIYNLNDLLNFSSCSNQLEVPQISQTMSFHTHLQLFHQYSIILVYLFILMYMIVLLSCMFLHKIHALSPQKSEECIH